MDFWLAIALIVVALHLAMDIRLGLVAIKAAHRRDVVWTSVTIAALLVHVWMDWR